MKTIALTLAATLIASTSALASDSVLFSVNDGVHRGAMIEKVLDNEPTASIATAPRSIEIQSAGATFQKDRNPALFDVDD